MTAFQDMVHRTQSWQQKHALLLCLLLVLLCMQSIPAVNNDWKNQPPSSKVQCETTKGTLTIDVHKNWAPIGAAHFIDLVKQGFYTDIAFFRCVKGFLTQFGLTDNKELKHFHYEEIKDDVNLHMGIQKNFLSFAGGGANTRSTQLFIAFEYLDFLGKEPWETPFGVVVDGQSVLDNLYKGYGEMIPFNKKGIDQQKIQNIGNSYVRNNFPKTDFLLSCRVVEEDGMAIVEGEEEIDINLLEAKGIEEELPEEELQQREEAEAEADQGEEEEEEEEEEESEESLEGEEALAEGLHRRDLPRGPEEVERFAAFERKTNKKGKVEGAFRDQLSSSKDRKLLADRMKHSAEMRGERVAMTAVGLLLFAMMGFYYFHRRKAMSAAFGKKS